MRGGKPEEFWPSHLGLARNQGSTNGIDERGHREEVRYERYKELMKTQIDDLLTKVLNKVEDSCMILQGMKSDISALSTTTVSHASSIKTLEER
ncbi:hypothetical protein KY284_035873 [Solanum tuberosum]|nr:hypothetical protein KY284_035873 [Solanum tuberosum]